MNYITYCVTWTKSSTVRHELYQVLCDMDYIKYCATWTISSTVRHELYQVLCDMNCIKYCVTWTISSTVRHELYQVLCDVDYIKYCVTLTISACLSTNQLKLDRLTFLQFHWIIHTGPFRSENTFVSFYQASYSRLCHVTKVVQDTDTSFSAIRRGPCLGVVMPALNQTNHLPP